MAVTFRLDDITTAAQSPVCTQGFLLMDVKQLPSYCHAAVCWVSFWQEQPVTLMINEAAKNRFVSVLQITPVMSSLHQCYSEIAQS